MGPDLMRDFVSFIREHPIWLLFRDFEEANMFKVSLVTLLRKF